MGIICGIVICCRRNSRKVQDSKNTNLDETSRKFGDASVMNDGANNQTMLGSDQNNNNMQNGPTNLNGQAILDKPWSGDSKSKDQFYRQPYKIGLR